MYESTGSENGDVCATQRYSTVSDLVVRAVTAWISETVTFQSLLPALMASNKG
ncbi:hypothetical protein ACPTC0_004686 [Escherichia coli]|uniref:hypothetical protein n=1 Tax=Escherichia coli TaxID=562 RepID=UPI000A4D58D6|nr:hypothetical protein [Escherichia coli]EFA8811043.1 hypothetical protein [Escherichia coli O8:H49]EFA7679395.1 hypothetical protein [Escherichia coli]EFL1379908.1 hypothetical protein [Escherichia coli]EFL7450932.1 hypothetical protein [Escherichia coli]EFM0009191.1 hypothetical protein [Escherichia coli]